MGGLSWIHWVAVLVIVILVFGTKKLRNIGQDLGGAVKGFKEGLKEGESTSASVESTSNTVPPAKSEVGRTIEGETTKH